MDSSTKCLSQKPRKTISLRPMPSATPCTAANDHYSITSSARASKVGGTMMPSAFAVFKLITSSNLVGCSTGRSAGFAPLKILSTKPADRRNRSRKSAP